MKRIRRLIILILMGLAVSNIACLDLAVIGISTAVRQAQNDKQIQRQRELDRQRAERDRQNYEAMQKLMRQNQQLMQEKQSAYTQPPSHQEKQATTTQPLELRDYP